MQWSVVSVVCIYILQCQKHFEPERNCACTRERRRLDMKNRAYTFIAHFSKYCIVCCLCVCLSECEYAMKSKLCCGFTLDSSHVPWAPLQFCRGSLTYSLAGRFLLVALLSDTDPVSTLEVSLQDCLQLQPLLLTQFF